MHPFDRRCTPQGGGASETMETINSFQNLIRFAIEEEKKAQELYQRIAVRAEDPYVRAILEGLHEQEVLHEEKLKSLLASVEP